MKAVARPILAVLIILLYVTLIVLFNRVNYYENYFERTGISVVAYNASRIFIIFGFLLIACRIGSYFIRGFHSESSIKDALDYFLISFMIGISLIQIASFILGMMGLLKWNIVIVPLILVLLSCHQALSNLIAIALRQSIGNIFTYVTLATVFTAFLVIRGQYPMGGHDYYTHYFDYLKEVVKTGSFAENISWNHFYYLKGMSLFFLASILTDPLAPSLVSSLLALVGMLIIYKIIIDSGSYRKIALAVSLIYIIFFAIGVDELEKQHAPLAVFMLAIFWLSTKLLGESINNEYSCAKHALILVITVAIIISPQIAVFILIYFLMFYTYCVYLRVNQAKDLLVIVSYILITSFSILLINYKFTGIPHEQYINLLWRYLDLNKVVQLGIIQQVIVMHHSFQIINSVGYSDVEKFSPGHFVLILKFLRLDLLWPLYVASPFFIFRIFFYKNQMPKIIKQRLILVACFTITALIITLFVDTAQRYSLYRFFGFFYPMPLILIGYLWVLHQEYEEAKKFEIIGKVLISISIVALLPMASIMLNDRPELKWSGHYRGNNGVGLKTIMNNGFSFATGEFSIKDAYQHQLGWEGKHPSGGIYPPMYEVWKIIRNAAVVSFHIHDYCMLPNCNVIRPTTHRFGKSWKTIYDYNNGTIEEVKASLKSEGINYFFISFEIPFWAKQHSVTLFNPDVLEKELEIAWTDGENYLLSWKGNGGYKITPEFIIRFKEKYWENVLPPSHQPADMIFNHIKDHEGKLEPFQLPWCTKCSGLVRLD